MAQNGPETALGVHLRPSARILSVAISHHLTIILSRPPRRMWGSPRPSTRDQVTELGSIMHLGGDASCTVTVTRNDS
jgi:hypothetical protein